MPPPPADGTTVAVDGTGLAPGAISTFFVNRARDRGQGRTWRHGLTWMVVVDLPRRILLAQVAKPGPTLVRPMAAQRCVRCSSKPVTSRPYAVSWPMPSSTANATICSSVRWWAQPASFSIIPAKRGKKTWQLHGVWAQMRAHFPMVPYRPRTLIELVFSAAKRKLSGRAAGRSSVTQRAQALLLGIAFNLFRFRPRRQFVRLVSFRSTRVVRMSTRPDDFYILSRIEPGALSEYTVLKVTG